MSRFLGMISHVFCVFCILIIGSCSVPEKTNSSGSQSNNEKIESLSCEGLTQEVAEQLFSGIETRESINKAINSCLVSAQKGDPNSQYNLSILYITKNDGKENQESLDWILRAANKGHSEAQYHLGTMYEFGTVVKHNIKDQIYWFQKAAEGGIIAAQLKLGSHYIQESDYIKGLFWYEKAASQGNREAMSFLIQIYSKGNPQFPPDKKKEEFWQKKYMRN
ncbi:MAG: sel1 repeat family protein [Desulfobulbaceae bacterium]|nr:sel1 repeat family protein [Desulfobulbaceae bacterium]